jgi:hypothetical protein
MRVSGGRCGVSAIHKALDWCPGIVDNTPKAKWPKNAVFYNLIIAKLLVMEDL